MRVRMHDDDGCHHLEDHADRADDNDDENDDGMLGRDIFGAGWPPR